MITFGMTAGNDNAIIWIIELETSSTPYYFCSGFNLPSITLDTGTESRVYSNKLQRNSLGVYPHSIPAESAGGMGSRNGFQFVIAGFGGIDLNDFYPATSAPNALMSRCKLGFVWTGATLTSEITWLIDGEVENYEPRQDGLYFDVTESNSLEYLTLPPYKVQKDFDDNFTYYPNAPEDVYGLAIPIVYGSFTSFDAGRGKYRLAPALLVDEEKLRLLATCHKCDSVFYDLESTYRAFKYLPGSESYIELVPTTGSQGNSFNGHYINLVPASARAGVWVNGNVALWKMLSGAITDVTNIKVLQEKNYSDDLQLSDGDKLGIQIVADFDKNFGIPNIGATDIRLVVLWQTSADGENRSIEIKFYNYLKSGGSGYTTVLATDVQNSIGSYKFTYYELGTITDGKNNNSLPWTWDELIGLQWVITNTSGVKYDSGPINIKNIYLEVNNIVMHSIAAPLQKLKINYFGQGVR